MTALVFENLLAIPSGFTPMTGPDPVGVLVCAPDFFDVVDVKNPFMAGQAGRVDHGLAQTQWLDLCTAFARAGLAVEKLEPRESCEDMVFCANPTFTGRTATGARTCVASRMRFASRQPEVEATVAWFAAAGYDIARSPHAFEGGGDAIWHPGRHLIWGGSGPRTEAKAYPWLARTFDAPVMRVELATELFYHLDTCFCPLDATTVMLHAPALTDQSLELIRAFFPRVVEVGERDAREGFACNAVAFRQQVILPAGCDATASILSALGYTVHEVDTSEFVKSGGSVFCLKQWLW